MKTTATNFVIWSNLILTTILYGQLIGAVRNTPDDIPGGSLSHGNCRVTINEFSTYPVTAAQFVELKTTCDKKVRERVSHFSMDGKDGSHYKMIFFDAAGFLIGVCDLKGKTNIEHGGDIYYTVGGLLVKNRDYHTEKCQFAQDHSDYAPGRFPAAMSSPIAVALLYNNKPSVISGVELDKYGLSFMKTRITYSMERVIVRNLIDMYVYSSSSPHSFCDYFGRYYRPYGDSERMILRDWLQKDVYTDNSVSRCDSCVPGSNTKECHPFQPDLFLATEKTPNAPNQCTDGSEFHIEDTQPKRKKPRIQPMSGGTYSCYISTEDSAIDMAGMISYPSTYMQKFSAALKLSSSTASSDKPNDVTAYSEVQGVRMSDEELPTVEPMDSIPFLGSAVTDSVGIAETIETTANDDGPQPLASGDSDHNYFGQQSILTSTFAEEAKDSGINLQDDSSALGTTANLEASLDSAVEHGYAKVDAYMSATSVGPFKISPINQDDFEKHLSAESPYVWENCERFQPVSLIARLKSEKNPAIDPTDILKPDVCFWFEYLPHSDSYRCKICNRLLEQKIIVDRKTSPLITPIMKDGQKIVRSNAKYRNRNTITDHLQNPLHLVSVDYFKLFDSGKRGKELRNLFERPDGELRKYFNATENFAVVVRQSTVLGLPFNKFPEMLELMEFFNINLGHVHHNPKGYKTMLMTLSLRNHLDLIEHLKTAKPTLSVMIDGSSDVSSLSSLVVMFMTYDENNNVGVVIYRVLPITERETGENMFNIFMSALREDGIDTYVKEKCVGLASDGASNMGVFKRLFQDYTDNELVLVHCMAHRIELVVKHAWADLEYLKYVQGQTNTVYRMFESNAPKKKQILLKKIEELGDTKFTLKIIKKIRWISSKLRALDVIFQHFPTIVAALQGVQDDRSVPLPQRQTAQLVETHLRDGTFLATLAFMADTAEEISFVSQDVQIRGSTLIGKKEKRVRMKSCVQKLLMSPGKRLSKLLTTAAVASVATTGPVTLKDFETGSASYQGIQLFPPQEAFADRLYLRRDEYINSILHWTDEYFPEDVTDNYEILDASKWPSLMLQTYGEAKLLELNTKLKWNFDEVALKNGWSRLKLSVARQPEFAKYKMSSPETFWTFFLGMSGIDWTPEIRTVVRNALTIPASTAEVERVFSMYTRTKTVDRYSLDISTVEAILRVKFNGGEPLKEFNALETAKLFAESHARPDDIGRRRPKAEGNSDASKESAEAETTERTSSNNSDSERSDVDALADTFLSVDGYEYGDIDY